MTKMTGRILWPGENPFPVTFFIEPQNTMKIALNIDIWAGWWVCSPYDRLGG